MELSVVAPGQYKQELYPIVYIEVDGTAREVFSTEREYLETGFHPNDGARPYVKKSYASLDGRNSIAGFCHRADLPVGMVVHERRQYFFAKATET